ncbi:Alpha-muurolene synthase [Hypsizygus marmoreus]|uniref:Alpha-muurolene synthase n=1 Tax=Hypsizygus marmoreus TaxID=39966 RepID=A0A369JNF0_HYPMA|nr:Alpha-muurolene synthase [Hypsizygus marmoreus]
MSPSYQLPDLLSLSRPFELRTNRSCRCVTIASESWLLSLKTPDFFDVLSESERRALSATKIGLLAALCFPGCDLPQLRFFTDFLSFLMLSAERILRARNVNESGWLDGDYEGGVDRLIYHELFQHLESQLKRLVSRAESTWNFRFAHSVHAYRSAQLQSIYNRVNNVLPELEAYLALRRDLCGLNMMLDLVEIAEDLTSPRVGDNTAEKLENLKQLAIDIIVCSLDVVAFNNDQAQGNRQNLIAILMTHRRLTIQGALNLAGTLIKDMFDSFGATERSLLDDLKPPTPPQTNLSGNVSLSSYLNWTSLTRTATPPTPPAILKSDMESDGEHALLCDLSSYIQVLKDCIVGSINWAYETELYFGKKGEEIRTFGWVFLNPSIQGEV